MKELMNYSVWLSTFDKEINKFWIWINKCSSLFLQAPVQEVRQHGIGCLCRSFFQVTATLNRKGFCPGITFIIVDNMIHAVSENKEWGHQDFNSKLRGAGGGGKQGQNLHQLMEKISFWLGVQLGGQSFWLGEGGRGYAPGTTTENEPYCVFF